MARYLVTLSATTQQYIEAATKEKASQLAHRNLDPDVDWDADSVDDVTDNEEFDLFFEK